MNRIRLLTEQVANQIAAGEVIERPASVVKELVENSLDARAGRVTVEVQAGGRQLVRVTDDGLGMSRDDALLSLERHATSKIRLSSDLASIATMGFRGEAVPSIASVSRMTITTRERDSDALAATQILINGGKILEVKDASGPPGTSFEIRSLFFNVPARRKFLRSDETERAHIHHYLALVALAYPQVALTFVQDERLIWQLPALDAGDDSDTRLEALRQRLRAVYGGGLRLVPVNFAASTGENSEGEDAGSPSPLRVWGFIGAPGVSRATRQDQNVFVNRRPVENRGINYALLEGYHTALMKGRFPVGCLFLELDPAEVDVNIHPAKREVRFHHERAVRQWVTEAVRRALLDFHAAPRPHSALPESPGPTPARGPRPPVDPAPHTPAPEPIQPGLGPMEWPAGGLTRAPIAPIATAAGLRPARPALRTGAPPAAAPVPGAPDAGVALEPPDGAAAGAAPAMEAAAAIEGSALLGIPLRIIGVIGRLYVVLESDRGLVLMDQHAAHERVLYERMLERLEQGQAPSQRLLLPETIELPPRDAQFLREQLATLTRLGIGLNEFGERTFLLDALPPFVRAADARRFVLEVIDELRASGQTVNTWRLGEQMVAKTVCRHAVKANDPLAGAELEGLLEDLRRCAMPYTCPHGRPTLIEINYRDLEKKFGRVV